jgi:hypothetical protein
LKSLNHLASAFSTHLELTLFLIMLVKIPGSLMAAGVVALSPTIAATRTTHTISKDVVIVGGGAAGAYAAVRLREDYGQSIALIEKQGLLVSLRIWFSSSLMDG